MFRHHVYTKEEFDHRFDEASNRVLLVFIYEDKMLCHDQELIEKLSSERKNLAIIQVNHRKIPEVAEQFGAKLFPSLIFFKYGVKIRIVDDENPCPKGFEESDIRLSREADDMKPKKAINDKARDADSE